MSQRTRTLPIGLLLAAGLWWPATAQTPAPFDASAFADFAWRPIGPALSSAIVAVAGVPGDANVFYAGAPGGGLWRTTDAGGTWTPIAEHTLPGSIDAIAVAASDSRVVYAAAGSAELSGTPADAGSGSADSPARGGIYRSTDAGRTWTRQGGLAESVVTALHIDPTNADTLVAAVRTASHGGVTSGVRRSTDGGRTFASLLEAREGAQVRDVVLDPSDARRMYALLAAPRESADIAGDAAGVFATTDAGATWQHADTGLPLSGAASDRGRGMSLAIAPSRPRRLFAIVASGPGSRIYCTDDGGTAWVRMANLEREARAVAVDPQRPDVVYVAGSRFWQSTDGGRTFAATAGVPLNGTATAIWIDPAAPTRIVLAGTRGATVTVNGGATWSTPDALPAAALDHIGVDDAFPARICGATHEAIPVCVSTSGAFAARPAESDAGGMKPSGPDLDPGEIVGLPDSGFVATDPNDIQIVYSGAVNRLDRRTGEVQDVRPPASSGFRPVGSAPLVFLSINKKVLLAGTNRVWKTTTGGQSWTMASPELARDPRTGAIDVLEPSTLDGRLVWAGTSDGWIHVTRDGGETWRNVTPADEGAATNAGVRTRVAAIEASHFDPDTAYAVIEDIAAGGTSSRAWRTRDGGQTWTPIGRSLARDRIHVVREDEFRRGLLFAGTDRSVAISFDDGDSWQPFGLNLPDVPVMDVAVAENGVAIATGGRGVWMLDDLSPLRQMTPDILRAPLFLFRPATAWRLRAGEPSGAGFAYSIGAGTTGSVTLEIVDSATGTAIRRFTSEGAHGIPATPGLHRVVWDLRYPPLPGGATGTSGRRPGAMVRPGTYQVRLTAGGRTLRQAIGVRLDPRIATAASDVDAQFALIAQVQAAAAALASLSPRTPAQDKALSDLLAVFDRLQQSDTRPTAALESDVRAALAERD